MNKIFINFFLRDIPIHIVNLITGLLPNHMVTNRIRGLFIGPFLKTTGKKTPNRKGRHN